MRVVTTLATCSYVAGTLHTQQAPQSQLWGGPSAGATVLIYSFIRMFVGVFHIAVSMQLPTRVPLLFFIVDVLRQQYETDAALFT